jgi:prepilin-type N-terminal cleavage/methylation domain-containing protein
MHKHNKGFTLVELLIVIVVIAILAAITVVVYNGLSSRANDAAIKSEIANVDKKIRVFQELNGKLPTTLQCPETSEDACINTSSGVALNYSADNSTNPPTYTLTATRGNIQYASNGVDAPVKRTAYTINNMNTNGDFSNGITGYGNGSCRLPSSCNVVNNELVIDVVNGSRAPVLRAYYGTYNDLDKIYYGFLINKVSGMGFKASAYRNFGGYEQSIISATQYNAMASGQPQRVSTVRTFRASQGTFTHIKWGEYGYGFDFKLYVDNVVVINLTKDFGAGNEPSAATVDAMINDMPGGYFEGSATVFQ